MCKTIRDVLEVAVVVGWLGFEVCAVVGVVFAADIEGLELVDVGVLGGVVLGDDVLDGEGLR